MKTRTEDGIVLGVKPIFEKDRRIEIFTKDNGRYSVLARGANSSNARSGSCLDVGYYIKFGVFLGKSQDILTHYDIHNTFNEIRSDFNLIVLVGYFFNIIRSTTMYNQKNSKLYSLLLNILVIIENEHSAINNSDKNSKEHDFYNKIKKYFYTNFLRIEGLLSKSEYICSDVDFQVKLESYAGVRIKEPFLI